MIKKFNIDTKDVINPINNNRTLHNKSYIKKRKIYSLQEETENNDNLNIDENNKEKIIIKSKYIYDENKRKMSQENESINGEKNISN